MKEYYGDQAKVYKQTKTKKYMLLPAIEKYIAEKKQLTKNLLDVGCGDGVFANIAAVHGFDYLGIDISEDMIARAKEKNPNSNFIVSSATKITNIVSNKKFDLVLSSMLIPSMSNWNEIEQTVVESTNVLAEAGWIILGTTHPCFDGYMQKALLRREDIDTTYESYFNSGAAYTMAKNPNDTTGVIFNDYHWQLSDYFKLFSKLGLKLIYLDECPPTKEGLADSEWIYTKGHGSSLGGFPTYILFVLGK